MKHRLRTFFCSPSTFCILKLETPQTLLSISLGKNDVKLLNSAVINEFTMLTYRRPLARDDQYDTSISTNQSQAVIWAMGPINSKVNQNYLGMFHHPYAKNFITHPTIT